MTTIWTKINTWRISRMTWPLRSRKKTHTQLSFDMVLIWLSEGVIMGHCMSYFGNDLLWSCLTEEESLQYLLCDFPTPKWASKWTNVYGVTFLMGYIKVGLLSPHVEYQGRFGIVSSWKWFMYELLGRGRICTAYFMRLYRFTETQPQISYQV